MKTHFTRYSLVYKDLHALGDKANLLLHNMKVRLGDALNNFPNFVKACLCEGAPYVKPACSSDMG